MDILTPLFEDTMRYGRARFGRVHTHHLPPPPPIRILPDITRSRTMLGLRGGMMAIGKDDDEMYKELFANFIMNTFPTDKVYEIPLVTTGAKKFVFSDLDGARISLPDVYTMPMAVANFGFYQSRMAEVRFPNYSGSMSGQMFNDFIGPSDGSGADIYLPKITSFNDSYALYHNNDNEIRYHFGMTRAQITGLSNFASQLLAKPLSIVVFSGDGWKGQHDGSSWTWVQV